MVSTLAVRFSDEVTLMAGEGFAHMDNLNMISQLFRISCLMATLFTNELGSSVMFEKVEVKRRLELVGIRALVTIKQTTLYAAI